MFESGTGLTVTNGRGNPDGVYHGPDEEPIDVRSHLRALRRSWLLMTFIVLVGTAAAAAYSITAEKSYEATAELVLSGEIQSVDVGAIQLNTAAEVLTSTEVLRSAARRIGGTTISSLRDGVRAELDAGTSIVKLRASASSARRAAQIANAVIDTYLARDLRSGERRNQAVRGRLLMQLRVLQTRPSSPLARLQANAIREQLSAQAISGVTETSDFEVVERASASTAVESPKTVRNVVLVFFASLLLAALVAVARSQLLPRVRGPRELGQILGLPILARFPRGPARRLRGQSVTPVSHHDATSMAVLRSILTTGERSGQRVILVTSAVAGEGKTRLTADLGRALARAGHKTLVVDGDLRAPALHAHFGVSVAAGVADLLAIESSLTVDRVAGSLSGPLLWPPGEVELRMLSAGREIERQGDILSTTSTARLLGAVRELDFTYVLIDAPPLLGFSDAQILAGYCDAMIVVVSQPDSLLLRTAHDLREELSRFATPVLGLVVTDLPEQEGAPPARTPSAYYVPAR
ncbi:MAG TPA: Wzz/FepE/Etk N-terminal domain-containing protein [Solirubrobacteraceae bacterium]|nr:Wzz/FepE/Etk N-terminal domain-containing protein [Solirubrobacteraceae bacterium]